MPLSIIVKRFIDVYQNEDMCRLWINFNMHMNDKTTFCACLATT